MTYLSAERELEISFVDGTKALLSAEFLRVHSPSAEVRGHSDAERVLQTGKKHVRIEKLEPVGNYAIRIVFSDGHDTGIYSWEYLHDLFARKRSLWSEYLADLQRANASRLEKIPVGFSRPDPGP